MKKTSIQVQVDTSVADKAKEIAYKKYGTSLAHLTRLFYASLCVNEESPFMLDLDIYRKAVSNLEEKGN